MGTIILGIKPEQIDRALWKTVFLDAMKISRKGELSRSVQKTQDGIKYWCNQLSMPSAAENTVMMNLALHSYLSGMIILRDQKAKMTK